MKQTTLKPLYHRGQECIAFSETTTIEKTALQEYRIKKKKKDETPVMYEVAATMPIKLEKQNVVDAKKPVLLQTNKAKQGSAIKHSNIVLKSLI